MTFDFAPDWLDTLAATDFSQPVPPAAVRFKPSPAASPLMPPAPPTLDQMADLVGELFTEGSLSFEQLCSLSNVPELSPLLGDTLANVAPSRRKGAAAP